MVGRLYLLRFHRDTAQASTFSRRIGEYLVLGGFALVCLAYFLICRRLSLVFEWAFLGGFPAALFPWLARRWLEKRWPSQLVTIGCEALALTAFYWSGLALLWSKY